VVAPVDKADFDKLEQRVTSDEGNLRTLVSQLKGGLPDVSAFRTKVDTTANDLTALSNKVNNPSWFKEQWAKGDIQLAATHAQLFKLDYSAIKFDEKGLTIFGRPVLGTDFVTNNNLFQSSVDKVNRLLERLRVERPEDKLAVLSKRLDTELAEVSARIREKGTQIDRVQSEVREALIRGSDARSRANQARMAADEARRRADRAKNDVQALERQADKTSRQVVRLRQTVNDLNQALR
jgi:hypothetical protein